MKESSVLDIDKEIYPDVLSLNYKKILEETKPFQIALLKVDINEYFIERPYIFVGKYYGQLDELGQVYYDDFILDLNNIKHKDSLTGDETLLFPDKTEMESFVNSLQGEV